MSVYYLVERIVYTISSTILLIMGEWPELSIVDMPNYADFFLPKNDSA
jgi:hypothetical protein